MKGVEPTHSPPLQLPARRPERGIARDERGVLLVVGAVMGVLLVGALWYVASVGDAILFRERMQDAADATAFEDAVWHARGMNVIALLNVIMSAVLSVLVLLRVFELLCTAYLALTSILCVASLIVPFLGVACNPLLTFARLVERALEKTLEIDHKVSPKIMDALLVLAKSERVVASVTPIVALVESSANNSAYYGGEGAADFTAALSLSLMPVELDLVLQQGFRRNQNKPGQDTGAGGTLFPVRMGTLNPGRPGTIPDKPGGASPFPSLPVSEEGHWMVCQRAGAFLPRQLGELAERAGAKGLGHGINLFADVLGEVTASVPSLSCSPWDKTAAQSRLDDAVKAKCRAKRELYEAEHRNGSGEVVPPWNDKMEYGCKKQHKTAFGGNIASVDSAKCAKIWDISRNGSVFTHTWSFARASAPSMLDRDDSGLAVADQGSYEHLVQPGRDGSALNMDSVNFSVAEAEYYFDCPGSWGGSWRQPWSGSNYSPAGSCGDNATWQLRWTARMHRVWWPQDEVSLLDIASGWMVNASYKYAGYHIGYLTRDLNPLISKTLWDTWITNQFIKKNTSYGLKQIPGGRSLDSTGYWLMQELSGHKRRTLIH